MLTRPVLLYDGDCAFCRKWVTRIRRRDPRASIELLPSRDRRTRPDLPPLADADLERAMHLVLPDGRVLAGGAAIPEIVRRLRGGALLRLPFLVPGVPRLTGWLYRRIAERRHRLGCGDGACAGRGG